MANETAFTEKQEDAVYGAYMGICVLSTMCKKAGLSLARVRAEEVLHELAEAFPIVYERVLISMLRSTASELREKNETLPSTESERP